jgi:hypothetical protein
LLAKIEGKKISQAVIHAVAFIGSRHAIEQSDLTFQNAKDKSSTESSFFMFTGRQVDLQTSVVGS